MNLKNYLTFLVTLSVLFPTTVIAATNVDLIEAALERTHHTIMYDSAYYLIKYPGGDVPSNIGVCTDVIIRSYRKLGIDLQELIHEDMVNNFSKYPSKKLWGLNRPDANIDHRRVSNMQVFFTRKGQSLRITNKVLDFIPGDLVTWILPGNLPHIGIVTNQYSKKTGNPMTVHNIGRGPKLEDVLFAYPISGHYRYLH